VLLSLNMQDAFEIRPEDLALDAPKPRTLWNSTFLEAYDDVPRCPDALKVIEHFAEVAHPNQVEAYRTLFRKSKDDSEDAKKRAACAAVRQWSSGGDVELPKEDRDNYPPLFKALNQALITDDPAKLFHFSWFIRAMNSHLTNPDNGPKTDLITWRGSKIDPAQAALLVVGAVIRPCMYVASSLDRSVAEVFVGEHGYLFKLHIPAGCRNASVIYEFARIQDEKEVLIPPYTPFQVTAVNKCGPHTIIELNVLDGMVFKMIEDGCKELLAEGMSPALCGKPARSCVL